jgi:hypothetical protein
VPDLFFNTTFFLYVAVVVGSIVKTAPHKHLKPSASPSAFSLSTNNFRDNNLFSGSDSTNTGDNLISGSDSTDLEVAVAQLIHQNEDVFQRLNRNDKFLYGNIQAPSRCGIHTGSGSDYFLFTGRMRLGEAKLGCAPFYNDWLKISSRAECVYD